MRRREFLGSLALTGALPFAGCGRSPEGELPGRIVGANFRLGHLLRDGKFPAPARTVKVDTAILGGGMAALSAAWKLTRSGYDDFCLFELESEMGGNSRGARYGPGLSAPWAAHYLPVPTRESTAVLELLQEMGLLQGWAPDGSPLYDEEQLCHDPQERLYAHGAWEDGLYPRFGASRDDLRQLDEFHAHVKKWKGTRDRNGAKAFAIPLQWSSSNEEIRQLDGVTMADYLRQHGWTGERIRWYVEYGCRDDYGTNLETTSAWAGLQYFAARDGGGFRPEDSQFVWPEGNQHLAAYLLKQIGERYRTGCLVRHVEPHADGVRCDVYDSARREVFRVECRQCLFCLPSFLRGYVGLPTVGRSFTYAPWVVANLLLEAMPSELPGRRPAMSWDNVFYDSPSLGYVLSTHQGFDRAPHPSVLTWYCPFTGADPAAARKQILDRSWSEWRDLILAELVPVHPNLRDVLQRLDVMLLGHAMIRPVPGLIWGEERQQALRPHQDRIFFAHSDLSGISIFEEANYQGIRAAQELMARRGHKFQDSLRP